MFISSVLARLKAFVRASECFARCAAVPASPAAVCARARVRAGAAARARVLEDVLNGRVYRSGPARGDAPLAVRSRVALRSVGVKGQRCTGSPALEWTVAKMCVAMVVIDSKALEKKAVDDVTSRESLHLREPPAMSQTLFPCGIMESGRWPEAGGGGCGVPRPVGSSLENLWDSVRETGTAGGISGLLRDLSLSEASPAGSAAPPRKRQCRSLSCSDELGCRSSWRPQGSRVWTAVEKRRCHSGGSVQRGAFAPSGFPAMQRSSSFSHAVPFPAAPQTLYLSHEQICPTAPSSPDSTPELERRATQGGLARSQSQPCVHNHKKTGVKRRRPADSHKQRPSLDLLKMTQKLQDFHSLGRPGFTGRDQTLPSRIPALPSDPPTADAVIGQSEAGCPGGKERECLWAGLCSRRGRDLFQLDGELDIEQIERN